MSGVSNGFVLPPLPVAAPAGGPPNASVECVLALAAGTAVPGPSLETCLEVGSGLVDEGGGATYSSGSSPPALAPPPFRFLALPSRGLNEARRVRGATPDERARDATGGGARRRGGRLPPPGRRRVPSAVGLVGRSGTVDVERSAHWDEELSRAVSSPPLFFTSAGISFLKVSF
mmetsp:Transcript_21044/g.46749  ORF Transcript_21044/g.46749 Transcript_21044/m.46749 type:complete len:174 (-) Transcript_21044:141-662(-)